jgi:hypothetical protein
MPTGQTASVVAQTSQTTAQPILDRADIPLTVDSPEVKPDPLDSMVNGGLRRCMELNQRRDIPRDRGWLLSTHFENQRVEIDTGADDYLVGRVLEIVGGDFAGWRDYKLRVLLRSGKVLVLPMTFVLAERVWITEDAECDCCE